MNQDEFYEYVEPIAGRRNPSLLSEVGYKWGQEKYKQEQEGKEIPISPFEYIEGEYSPYLGVGVYSYIRNALKKGHRTIRLGSANAKMDVRSDTSDDFSQVGEAIKRYFLEVVRFDQVLAEHLKITQEDDILVISMHFEE